LGPNLLNKIALTIVIPVVHWPPHFWLIHQTRLNVYKM